MPEAKTHKYKSTMRFYPFLLGFVTSTLTYYNLSAGNSARAQITPDNTLGAESSIVTSDQIIKGIPSDRIDGGAIRAGNLFHSFKEFNINSGKGAYFTNPSGIENILTRVTGNNRSEILGTLGVLGNANLFFINPNGIIFGKNAVLDIRGSFTATTADGIRLGEDGLFSATNPQSSNLLTVQPGALFSNALSNQQATINNQSNLTVDDGKNINLFGTNVINTGTLTAPEGTVQLIGTENLIARGNITTATLLLSTRNLTIAENNNDTVDKTTLESLSGNTNLILQATNDILINPLSNHSLSLAEGRSKITFTADADLDGIGNFQMATANIIKTNGRNTEITGVNLTVGNIDTSDISENKLGGGNITLTATRGDIFTQNLNSNSSDYTLILTNAEPNGSLLFNPVRFVPRFGDGGAITLTTTQGNIITANLSSSSSSVGNGGTITLTTTQGNISTGSISSSGESGGGAITLSTADGNISTQGLYSGGMSGGAITLSTTHGNISTGNLTSFSDAISGGFSLTTGGAITLTTTQGNIITGDLNSHSSPYLGNAGSGGAITLTTTQGNIITGDLHSYSDAFFGNSGNGGAITLTTTEGNISTGNLTSFSSSYSKNSGNGGGIILSTTEGNISTGNLASFSFSNSSNSGNGGAISLYTTEGNISTGNLESYSFGSSRVEVIIGVFTDTTVDFLPETNGNGGEIELPYTYTTIVNFFPGTSGNGGEISLIANGDIKGIKDEIVKDEIVFPSFSAGIKDEIVFSSFSASRDGISGQGGNVTLAAKNKITDLDIFTLSSSNKSGDVQVNGFGDLSLTNTNIITSKQVTVKTRFEDITLDISGVGQSGNVNITSIGNLTFKDSRIENDTKGSDPAGNVNITIPGTVSFNNSKIVSSTSSTGNAGNIQVNAKNFTLTDISEISASTTADGKAGDITLNTPTLTLANGAKIFATTTGNGDGGTITINAPNKVNLGIGVQDFAPILSVETSGAGEAGDIIVNTPSLTVSDTARITATATATATNKDGGGSITLNASKMDLAGIVGIFAETQGQAPAGTLKLNPYQKQPNLDITLFPNSTISASTSASGNGGDLLVSAPQAINISGQGKLAVETTGTGDAGNIEIGTQKLTLSDGVEISASTASSGKGGNLAVNAAEFTLLQNQSRLLTQASGTGKAGNITINTPE